MFHSRVNNSEGYEKKQRNKDPEFRNKHTSVDVRVSIGPDSPTRAVPGKDSLLVSDPDKPW